jgi:tyrosine-protein kinase Etk/Wzc
MNDFEKVSADEPEKSMPVVAVQQEEQDGVDLRDILGVIAAGKWIILAVTAGLTALAVAYALVWPPTYEVDTVVQVNQFGAAATVGAAAGQSSLIDSFLPTGTLASAEIPIMTSRAVLLPVIYRMHLNIIINKPIPVIGKLFKSKTPPPLTVQSLKVPDRWKDENLTLRADGGDAYTLFSLGGRPLIHGQAGKEASALAGRVKILVSKLGARAGRTFKVMRLYDSEAVYDLQENLTTTQLTGSDTATGASAQSGVVQLVLDGKNAYAIKAILNAITDQYLKENVAAAAGQAQKSLRFVKEQLPIINQKQIGALTELSQYEAKHGVVNVDAQTQLVLQQMGTYESQLTQLELTRLAIAQQYTTNFPGYAAIVSQEQSIRQKIAALNDQLRLVPQQNQGYVELQRDATVYGTLYQTLLATEQSLEISQAGTVGTARIVSHALTPYEPEWPIAWLVIAIGVVMGLIFGVIAVLLKSVLSRGVFDATVLEQSFGLPVYAIIPHSKQEAEVRRKTRKSKAARLDILAREVPTDPAVEAMRSLRTSLNFALWDSPRKVLTFSGTSPGVGKSFLSANMAHILAAADQRVLVIDADMRKGHLHRYFGLEQKPGLSQALTGQHTLEAVIRRGVDGSVVDFMPCGPYPPGVFELIAGSRFKEIVEECAARYDYVIIDVPPVLAVAEGILIARLASANLKAGGQTEREIQLSLERMRQNGVRLLGFVFNDLTPRAVSATFGRYYGGGGDYAYAYGSKAEAEKA